MLLRYIVNDVQEVIDFYTSKLGFELKKSFAPAVAFLDHGDLHQLVSGPDASASEPMLDGAYGAQIICEDPSGNVIELRQPPS